MSKRTMSGSAEKKVLDLVRKRGILRPRDLQSEGLPTDYLWRLHQKDKLVRVGKGMYVIPGVAAFKEHKTTVEAAMRINHRIVCL